MKKFEIISAIPDYTDFKTFKKSAAGLEWRAEYKDIECPVCGYGRGEVHAIPRPGRI